MGDERVTNYGQQRRRLSGGCLNGIFLGAFLAGSLSAADPVFVDRQVRSIGSNRQMFVDDDLLDPALSRGATRTLNGPLRVQRVIKPDRPSEALGFIFYCSVVDDKGTAMLFHGSYDADKKKHFALASSEDGIHWRRPELGRKKYRGNTANNLFPFEAVEASVFLDPNAPASKRFRLLYSRHWPDPARAGIYLASSPDGIEWTESETRVLPFVPDSQHCGLWDAALGKYVIYTRAWSAERERVVARVAVDDIEKPWPYDNLVPPLHVWGVDKVPTLSRELPIVMACDERDPPGVQLYTSAAIQYPFAPNVWLAFPAAYQTFKGREWKDRALNGNDGTFDVHFATSRDGVSWQRWRRPYVAAGHLDGLDLRLVSMGQGMIRRGRELHQYFVGWPHTHGRPVVWDRDQDDRAKWLKKDLGGIYCATQRVDGFVSMDAGFPGGKITTKPLRFKGGRLLLNVHTQGSGGVRAALLNAEGMPFPGFSAEDCESINVDEIDHEVRWKSGSDISSLEGKIVRVEFSLRNARLFAFQFDRPSPLKR